MEHARPAPTDTALSVGKRTRLHRLRHSQGPANGTLLLSADQGLERGPVAFASQPETANPDHALRLALEGGCSGIILGIGHAERYLGAYAGRVPLLLKLNGKTDVPPDDEALAPLNATVEDAVRLGADGVAYTLYAGSPAQFEDLTQFSGVRRDCQAFGMPLLVLATPCGAAIERRGGPTSLYALEYAARIVDELGADLAGVGLPVVNPQRDTKAPKPYDSLQVDAATAIRRLVASANRTPVLLDLGGAEHDDLALTAARQGVEAGAVGLILGRVAVQQPFEAALALVRQLRGVLSGTAA